MTRNQSTGACPDPTRLLNVLQATPAAGDHQVEVHLEQCPRCQQRLSEMAGEPELWDSVVATLQADSRELKSQSGSPAKFGLAGFAPTLGSQTPGSGRDGKTDPRRAGMDHLAPTSHDQFKHLFDPPVHPEMLGRLGRFDIEALIGRGGFGTVWKAWDTELNRPVAIKILASHLADNATARRRFVREAQSAAAVNHANVVPIHAVHGEAKVPWLVMSYVPGHSLEEVVRREGPLPTVTVVQIAMQVASGLAAAHQQGLVHRDIKPANILIEADSTRALITDFGLARAADDASVTQTGWLAGTPHYMSPEQAQGRDIDTRSDLFSLGSVLYYLATGRQAFRAEQTLVVLQQIANSSPLPARSVNAEVPGTLSRIIMRLLEKHPRDRFRSAEDLLHTLRDYLAHLQHPQTRRRPRVGWTTRFRIRLAASLAVGLALLAGGILAAINSGWLLSSAQGTGPGELAGAQRAAMVVGPALAMEVPVATAEPFATPAISGAVEMLRNWNQFHQEISGLQSDLELLVRPADCLPEPWSPLIPGDTSLRDLESRIETLESGSFLAVPRTANPKQPASEDDPDGQTP